MARHDMAQSSSKEYSIDAPEQIAIRGVGLKDSGYAVVMCKPLATASQHRLFHDACQAALAMHRLWAAATRASSLDTSAPTAA
jgi:hypothetical protein